MARFLASGSLKAKLTGSVATVAFVFAGIHSGQAQPEKPAAGGPANGGMGFPGCSSVLDAPKTWSDVIAGAEEFIKRSCPTTVPGWWTCLFTKKVKMKTVGGEFLFDGTEKTYRNLSLRYIDYFDKAGRHLFFKDAAGNDISYRDPLGEIHSFLLLDRTSEESPPANGVTERCQMECSPDTADPDFLFSSGSFSYSYTSDGGWIPGLAPKRGLDTCTTLQTLVKASGLDCVVQFPPSSMYEEIPIGGKYARAGYIAKTENISCTDRDEPRPPPDCERAVDTILFREWKFEPADGELLRALEKCRAWIDDGMRTNACAKKNGDLTYKVTVNDSLICKPGTDTGGTDEVSIGDSDTDVTSTHDGEMSDGVPTIDAESF